MGFKKYTAKRNISAIKKLYGEVKNIKGLNVSKTLVERISSSGDSTGTPFYHFRWKLHRLADFVAYPETGEHVKIIMELANKYTVSVTPRGSGSDYYGSGCPANGGLLMDMKRLKKFEIDKEKMVANCEPGLVFDALKQKLERQGLTLGCYPTSAYTTTIGGWVGTGGTCGVGTIQSGSLIDQVEAMTIVSPSGEEKMISNKKDMKQYYGANGVFGIITKIALKIYPLPKREVGMSFGFDDEEKMYQCIKDLNQKTNPYFLRFSDMLHEYHSTGFTKYAFNLFLILNGRMKPVDEEINETKKIAESFGGVYLGDKFSKEALEDNLKHEMRIKLDTPVLMLQQIYIEMDTIPELMVYFKRLINKYKLNHTYYAIVNKDLRCRLVIYTPTDNKYWIQFIASKGAIHKTVKQAYKLGGRIYSYGLQNTIYAQKYEQEKIKSYQALKLLMDPKGVLNPLKQVTSIISFKRIDTMFNITMRIRRLAVKLGRAQEILTPNLPGRH